ncbi:carboxylate-amine ligase [soil metagenome]
MNNNSFTIGIEEEFQIIDPVTRELKSHMTEIFALGKETVDIKSELHRSVVEVGTSICKDIKQAREEVINLRSTISKAANENGLTIGAAGTHPFSHWKDQEITDAPRYKEILNEMEEVARANLIFGLHVHIGVEDREIGIMIMNAARYFLPHIFALSTNSPFWLGRNTGFKSYRTKVFDKFPRTGIPDVYNSLAEYESYLKLLIKTNCIDNAKKIWWDIRLHPFFNTIEYRICDIPMRVDETIALAAIMQAVTVKLYKLIQKNLGFRQYRRALMNENKWRASRYGIEAKLIDFGKQEEVPFKMLAHELVAFVEDVLDELGSREEVYYLFNILEKGTGADRQIKVYNETNDLKKVVDFIVEETHIGLN